MTKNTEIQFVTDENGKKHAVLIPIKEWKKLQNELHKLREYKSLKESLSKGYLQMKKIKNGQLPKTSLSSFLNEC